MRTDTYSYEGRCRRTAIARAVARLLPTLGLVLGLASCGKENAIVLTIRPPAGVVLTEYALTVQDRDRRAIVYQSGVQPIDAVARGRDLNAEPLRIGLKLVGGSTFLVHVRASQDKLAPEGVTAPNPRTPEYFFAGMTSAQGVVELDAALLLVGPGYDRDFDHFPDAVAWPQAIPEAQMRYQDHPELLDCVDRDPAPGDPPLAVPYYAVQINPLAVPKCGLALDIACEAAAPACQDHDGDGDSEATDCDDNDPKRFHGNPRPRNCCQCTDRKSCETNHAKLTDLSVCQPARCDDPFDYDCSGQTVACFVDEDCDGFSPNDPIASLRDCDDTNPDVHPGAAKNCNDSSHDWACDGNPTAGCTPCDLDGDGYQRNDSANGCPTAGYNKAFDCNDNDRGVFPGSTSYEGVSLIIRDLPQSGMEQEGGGFVTMALRGTCRNQQAAYPTFQTSLINQDADCDGNARKGCPTAACDADGDGFPNMNAGCNPNGLKVDCNDADPKIFPGAPEKCGDGIAQGCSSDIACGTADADGDGYTATYDCDDGNANVHPWATELCNGVDDDCDGLIDEGNPDLTGAPLVKTTYTGGVKGITDCADDNDGECGKKNAQGAFSGRCVCTGLAPTGIVDAAKHTSCPGNVAGTAIGPKCFGATQPKLQTCVASTPKDEDCDGSTEAPTGTNLVEAGQACGNNTGECKAGVVTGCKRTGYVNPFYTGAGAPVSPAFDPERRFLVCSSAAVPPKPEICDNKDNDCNAVVDQTCTELAGAGLPGCCAVSMNPVCKDLSNDFNFCGSCTNQCNSLNADQCANKVCKCGANPACSGTAAVCKAGNCVQCMDDTNCTGLTATPHCNATTNKCVQCTKNAECAGNPAGSVCDPATNTCVGCVGNGDCAAPTAVCDTTKKMCVQCMDDGSCAAPTGKCKVAVEMCVECLDNTSCTTAAASRCDATNKCAMCAANGDCTQITGKNLCKAGTGCVGCIDNTSCATTASPICDSGATDVCRGCGTDMECKNKSAAKPICNGGPCVECKASLDCTTSATKPICNGANTCIACTTNAQCMARDPLKPNLVCSSGGACVECNTSAGCPLAKPVCTMNACTTCVDNTGCTMHGNSKVCDTAAGACIECQTSADCTFDATKKVCDNKVCVPCKASGDCTYDVTMPICEMNACRACMTNMECSDRDATTPVCDVSGKCTM